MDGAGLEREIMAEDRKPKQSRYLPAPMVLVADRDPLFARILASRLEKLGHKVEAVDSGAAALEWYRNEDVRIVILDFDLLDMGGIALVKAIRDIKRAHYTYVLFYSSRQDKDALTDALAAGADDFMQKPYNALEFRLRLGIARRLLDMDDELYHGGGTDRATGLLNRKALEEILPRMVALSQRASFTGTLLFVRLLNLRDVFQRHGYETAQRLVVETGRLLDTCHRGSDLMGKCADDEFCILLNTTAEAQCIHLAGRMQEDAGKIEIPLESRSGEIFETISPSLGFESVPFPPEADVDGGYLLDKAKRTQLVASAKVA